MATSTSTEPQHDGSWYALCRDKFSSTFPNTSDWKHQQKELTEAFQDTVAAFTEQPKSQSSQKTEFEKIGMKPIIRFDDQMKVRQENMQMLKDMKSKVVIPEESFVTRMTSEQGSKVPMQNMALGTFMRDYIQKTFPTLGELPTFSMANGCYTFSPSVIGPFAQYLAGFTGYNMAEASTAGPMIWTEEKMLAMLEELTFCRKDWDQQTLKDRKGNASGYFTMGGTFNLLSAMRLAMMKTFGTSFKQRGFAGVYKQMVAQRSSGKTTKLPDIKVFCSKSAHSCVEKVCDYLGLGTGSIVFVETKRVGARVAEQTKTKALGEDYKNEDEEQRKRDKKMEKGKKEEFKSESDLRDPFEFEMDYYDLETKLKRCLNRNDIVPIIVATQGTVERFCGDDCVRIRQIVERLQGQFGSTRMPVQPVIFNDNSIGFEWLFFKDYDFKKNDLAIPQERLESIRRICDRISQSCEESDVVGFNFHKAGLCPPNAGCVMFREKKDFYLTRTTDTRLKAKTSKTPSVTPELNEEMQTLSDYSMNPMAYDPSSLNLEYSRSPYAPLCLDMLLQFYGKEGIQAIQVFAMEIFRTIRDQLRQTNRFLILNTGEFNNTMIIRGYPSKLCKDCGKDPKALEKMFEIELNKKEEAENLLKEVNQFQIKLVERIKERNLQRKQQGLPVFDCQLCCEFGMTNYGEHFPCLNGIKIFPNTVCGISGDFKQKKIDFESAIKECFVQPLLDCCKDL